MMSAVKQILIILSFPMLYILTGLIRSHYHLEKSYFTVWGSILLLHWLNVLIVFLLLKRQQLSFKDFGFDIKNNIWFLLSYLIITITVILYLHLNHNQSIEDNLTYRIFEAFTCFTAGFCEELIWRGYSMSSLLKYKVNKAVIVHICSLSFCLMHWGVLTNPFYGCFIFAFGIVFSMAFLYLKRLGLLMFIHMTYDFLIMLFPKDT